MGYIIKMPKLGLEMEQGTVLEWKVEQGEEFAEGDVLAEVESEKSIAEVEAREDGALRRAYVEVEESVPPGAPIGIAAAPDADISDLEAEAAAELAEVAPEAAPADAATAETGGGGSATNGESEAASGGGDTSSGGGGETAGGGSRADDSTDVKASPRARQRAEELAVDLTTVEGTGFEGAITEEDVEAAAESSDEAAGADSAAAERALPPTAEGVVRIGPADDAADRYQHARAVAEPAAGAALFETMEAVRTAFEERVTMTDILLVLAASTLGDHAVLNGTYTESTHQVQERRDIALVADVNGGRAVGVIAEAGRRSLSELVDARQSIGGDDEADGATFTVANAAETEATGRLANPPAVAALEVDPTGQRAVPDGDGVELQPLVTASLTYDSRAVGAGEAQTFLETLFQRTEDAPELVLGSYRGTE